ncbi:hypothetical protein ACTQ5J_07095 [Fundicoccus sp. Sow4_F4]|uniref:hypothetical protein n=1 Tax=Fundicoccus sp. Sow4_F4 TaxID=3438783 RepID=UPI003F91E3BE
MNKVLNLDDYFVQKGIEELPGSLKNVLSRVVEDIAMFVKIVVANLVRNLSPDLAILPSVKTRFGLI